ncbi:N-acetylglucosaminyl deacetylase, LmbE family [Bryocella elongata]|uniref:N-acetylglucosaminyl deacetylase, LmbE family n=1 Tax=Bryocella elongata TaxID=863522 RepID=A0A1H5T5F7_9BACT|nr:PIG-L family deacetylase [Bryocella elongata]SEF58026.1 N-acetylglucosaminyl deacetylase, LmbE family [Bryocella elongata]
MPLRLLNVCAHPDDECFAFGGALALAADRHVEVMVLCLTDGQAGRHREDGASNADLARIRSEEFAASCGILGVACHEQLAYQDGRLEHEPLSRIAADIVRRIRSFQPHVVLTFGMDGAANTHPDHTSTSAAATAAFHWAGSVKRFPELGAPWQAHRLFHHTTDYFLPDRARPLPAPWTLTLDISSVFERKIAALRSHASQGPLAEKTIPIFEAQPRIELYTLMAAAEPQPATQSTDLFDSVTA